MFGTLFTVATQHPIIYYSKKKREKKSPENAEDGVLRHPHLRCGFNTYSIRINPNVNYVEMPMS